MLPDINKIDLSLLSSIKDEFKDTKNNFNHNSYNTFKSSYIYKSSDPNILKIKSKLEFMYETISDGYLNIYDWFNEYIKTASSLENSLANDSNSVSNAELKNFVSSKLMIFSNNVTADELLSTLNNKKSDFNSSISKVKNIVSDFDIRKASCTVVTTGVSLVEGVVKTGEYTWNILQDLADTAVRNVMFTSGKLTKADVEWGKNELAKKIGSNDSKELFDLIWDSDSMQKIKDNSYVYDKGRDIGNQSGKKIIMNLLNEIKVPRKLTAATFGYMEGFEAAYANGADYDKANMEGVKQASLDVISTSNDTPDIFGDFHKTATKYDKF